MSGREYVQGNDRIPRRTLSTSDMHLAPANRHSISPNPSPSVAVVRLLLMVLDYVIVN